MDTELFSLAVKAALCIPTSGIGTLSEKTVHSALKYYVQPDKEKHEAEMLGFICDALSEDGVFEIQTRAFHRLRKKLSVLLPNATVTVVYPIIYEKKLYTTDVSTGECTERKSPKRMGIYSVFAELYRIRSFITDGNLRIRLISLKVEERRGIRVTVSKRGKKRVETISSEVVPTEICGDLTLKSRSDYAALLPSGLAESFTSADLAAASKIPRPLAATALLLFTELGITERIGKEGNAYLYRLISE